MGVIQDWIARVRAKKVQKEDYEEGKRIAERYEEKKLNSNERELAQYQEEVRQKKVKALLDKFRKEKQHKIWHDRETNPIYAENIMRDDKNLFKEKNIFTGRDDLFLKNKNIFVGQKNIFKGS